MDYIINKEYIYKKSKALDKLGFSQKNNETNYKRKSI